MPIRGALMLGVMITMATAASPSLAGTSANPIQLENAVPGSPFWDRAAAPGRSIEGYVSEVSIAPGSTVDFHVATTPSASYRIEIFRIGWYGGLGARLVTCLPACDGDKIGARAQAFSLDPATGEIQANWAVTDSVVVPPNWTSGYYIGELVLTRGRAEGTAYRIPFVVRPAVGTPPSAILVQVPVNTWEAYNRWGGRSLYDGPDGLRAYKVSFDRPGLTDATGSGLEYEYPLVRFLERGGYDVSYTTDRDTDADPSELLRHRLVAVAGHSEYWTKGMRDAFDRALAAGTNLAFFGANDGYWQVRYEDAGHTLVGYKEFASLDPVAVPALKTMRFRDLVPPRPECALEGVAYEPGSWGTPSEDYTVSDAALSDPWFAGTGFSPGDPVHGLLGGEWDGFHPGCLKRQATVLFHRDGSAFDKPSADAVRYVAASGARVFSSGSHQFTWGLDDLGHTGQSLVDTRVEQFMRNALADLLQPAPPVAVSVSRVGAKVSVHVSRSTDPRVTVVNVYREGGTGASSVQPTGPPVCRTKTGSCLLVSPQPGDPYRFTAVTVDRWGMSQPVISARIAGR